MLPLPFPLSLAQIAAFSQHARIYKYLDESYDQLGMKSEGMGRKTGSFLGRGNELHIPTMEGWKVGDSVNLS